VDRWRTCTEFGYLSLKMKPKEPRGGALEMRLAPDIRWPQRAAQYLLGAEAHRLEVFFPFARTQQDHESRLWPGSTSVSQEVDSFFSTTICDEALAIRLFHSAVRYAEKNLR